MLFSAKYTHLRNRRKQEKRMKRWLVLILAAAALCWIACAASAEIIFSEVMASSAVFENGRHDDWIELHNTSAKRASLKGWYLSDSKKDLQKWAFPDGASIPANGYLVVYCTDDPVIDNAKKDALYANFKISNSGETLYLTDPDGETTQLKFGKQFGNVSSGIPEGGSEWLYLEKATPGGKNAARGYEQRAEEPVIETPAGFYEGSATVEITAPEGVEIRYTLDCATPGRDSLLYTGPITVKKTTVVRARGFGAELLGSTIAGATFFIDDPAPVPVVSLYTDQEYFFSNAKGILVKGSGKVPNYKKDWEYPVQIEYFDEGQVRRLCQMGTARVSGYSSRIAKQKSLAVYARSALGNKTFDYSFFEDRDYTQYSCLLLRSTNSDARSCRMRDAVFGQMSRGLGLYYQAGRPILVYLNGEYYGHYNLREKANKDSLAQWEGITDESLIDKIDILECTGMSSGQVIRGSNADWVELMNFCKKNRLNTEEKLNYVLDRLDVDSLFNYVIFNSLIGNSDVDNVRMYRFPGGKWKYMLHDIEAGCMNDKLSPVDNFLRPKSAKSANFAHWALSALLEVPEYREKFLRRTAEIIQSNFLYDQQVAPIYEKWYNTLAELMPRHIKKFKPFTMSQWTTNVNASKYYARVRPAKVIDYICSRLKVTAAEKKTYFSETLALLKEHNAKK